MTSPAVRSRTGTSARDETGLAQAWPDRFGAWLDDRLTRTGLSTEFQRDCALALLVFLGSAAVLPVLFTAAGPVEVQGLAPFHVVVVIVVLSAQALMLCLRRVSPALCLWMVALLQVALLAVVPGGGTFRGVAPFVAAYSCGALLPVARAARAVVGVAVLEGAAFAAVAIAPGLTMASQIGIGGPPTAPADVASLVIGQLLSSVVTYVAAAAVGAWVGTRRKYVELLRVRATELIHAQQARTDAAILAERSRMARELHDIAAHHLSGMVVQSAVVERLIDHDPHAAKEAAAWIRRQGRETLHNLRLVVGVLREPGHGEGRAGDQDTPGDTGTPVPGLAVLDRLVASARDLGTPVELVRDGQLRTLPPIADVTFYRVVQEALSNAGEHAPGAPVRIVLRDGESGVSLEVSNGPAARAVAAPPDSHRGFGLIGMGERAQMIGASFHSGPTSSGGWQVSMMLALQRETTRAATLGERDQPDTESMPTSRSLTAGEGGDSSQGGVMG
jgi:signal transduction histidine kinase